MTVAAVPCGGFSLGFTSTLGDALARVVVIFDRTLTGTTKRSSSR